MRAEAGLSMGGGPLPTQRAPQNPRVPFPDLSLEPALLHVLTSTGASPIGRSLQQVREGERETFSGPGQDGSPGPRGWEEHLTLESDRGRCRMRPFKF